MLQDFLVSIRSLLKRPGYASSVIATLALGIGGSTMMFSLTDAALLRPLPFSHPERLVTILGVAGPDRVARGASFPELADWRRMNTTLDDVSLYDETSLNLRIGQETFRVEAEMVSASYFHLLGAQAAIGRAFLPEEDAVPDRNPVAVVSARLWRERFGSDPEVLQRTLYLNDRAVRVVGVMPAGFAGVSFDTDVWVPSMMISLTTSTSAISDRGNRWLLSLARLKQGVPLSRAQEDMDRVAKVLEREHPETNRERGAQIAYVRDSILGDSAKLIAALFWAVMLFLLVACTNVAGLQVARAASRRGELAVRVALGANTWHLLRQLAAESVLLSLVAGTIGALVAAWAIAAAVAWMPAGAIPPFVQPAIDARALMFALGLSFLGGVLVAVFPVVFARDRDVAEALKDGTRMAGPGLGSIRRVSTQQLLVVTEIALAMTLLTCAALLARSLERQTRVSVGFHAAGVTAASLSLPSPRYTAAERALFVERLEKRVSELPGVRFVSISSDLPFSANSSASIIVPDHAVAMDGRIRHYRHFVTSGFFDLLGVPILRGRGFTAQDGDGAPLVAIINESAARRLFPDSDGVGRHIRLGTADGPRVEIVGVVRDARFRDLTTNLSGTRTEPDVFYPYAQRTDRDIELAVRTVDGGPAPIGVLQSAVSALDPGLPLFQVRSLEDDLRQQTSTMRFAAVLLTVFSTGALLLAGVGLYGLVAFVVGLSRREIAIRLALGASAWRVSGLVLRHAMTLVVPGMLAGAGGAILAGRLLQNQLFQTSPFDPLAYAAVALLLIAVAFAATLPPARRVAAGDTHAALRAS